MATNTLLKLKKSSVSGRIPDSADLAYGELAINYTDGKLWYKHSAGGVRSFYDSGSTATLVANYLDSSAAESTINDYIQAYIDGDVTKASGSLTINGSGSFNFHSTGNVNVLDDTRLRFGDSADLQIYHSSVDNNTYITNSNGNLYLQNDSANILIGSGINVVSGGLVSLSYNDSAKLQTAADGVDVIGNLDVTGSFTTITTDGLGEGSTNLYYTKTRTDSDISALVDSDYVAARTAVTDLVDSAYVSNLIDAATATDYVYQPTSNTTVFSDSDINGNILSYDLDMIDVYLNGIRLTPTLDYTATNGTSVTFLGDPASSGDTVNITGRNRVKLANGLDNTLDSDLSSTNQTSIDNFLMSRYRSAKYLVQLGWQGDFEVSELLIMHDGTSVYTTEYATVRSNGSLGDISASTDGTRVYVNVTATNANTNVKINRLRIDA